MDIKEMSQWLEKTNEVIKLRRMVPNLADKFNVFSVCGVNHYENKHSLILQTFLDPNGCHGFHAAFLQEFFEIVGVKDVEISEKTYVRTEFCAGKYGRFDIYIYDYDKKWGVVIENKIYAGEQHHQIQRYSNFLEKERSKGHIDKRYLYFLTPDRHLSNTSRGDCEYKPISYAKEIDKWLEKCIEISKINNVVCISLKQYKEHLNRVTGNKSKEEEKMNECEKKVVEVVARKCEAYFHLLELRSEVIKYLQSEIVKPVAERLKEEEICELEKDDVIAEGKKDEDTGFWFKVNGSDRKILLSAEYANCDSVYVGVWLHKEQKKDRLQKLLRGRLTCCSKARVVEEGKWTWVKGLWFYQHLPEGFKNWNAAFYQECISNEQKMKDCQKCIYELILELANVIREEGRMEDAK